MRKLSYISLFIIIIVSLLMCKRETKVILSENRDLEQIIDSSELVVLTISSSISYFIYKGEQMGYEYELIEDFAKSLGVKLNIKVVENVKKMVEMLENGEGDIIAYNIPVTNEMKLRLNYCGREVIDKQVLVQRSGKNDTILKDVTELIGKKVWVVDDSKYYNRLVNLNKELGGGIKIKDIAKDTVSVEDLIGYVARGEISYTLSDYDIARLNRTYHSNINIDLIVSHPQRSSWAVGKASPHLAEAVDTWFENQKNRPRYQSIMKRYFEMSKLPGEEPVRILGNGKISIFDPLFKKYAKPIDWDWRLLASVAYQESRFDTSGVSWAGAAGLMGLMPRTAENFGVNEEERFDPEKSLIAASAYFTYLGKLFPNIKDPDEKIKFVLASYNSGPGHVFDAQALAEKYGKDPFVWNGNVEEYTKLKSLPEYYNDSICKSGYLRGTETVNYVEHILDRWEYFKELAD